MKTQILKNKIFTLHEQSGLWVSRDGEVYSPKTKGHSEHFTYGHPDCSSTYLRVMRNRKNYKIHRLVSETYLQNPDNLPQINHKDENTANNCVENLEWCTASYNINHGTRNERVAKANTNGKCSKTVEQYSLDGKLVNIWPSVMEVQRVLGYKQSYISVCCNGKRKTAYGFIWQYVA